MKLSILVLTHKRPEMFEQCLNSILRMKFNFDFEILVNNDSRDIIPITDSRIKYSNVFSNDISDLYKHLYDKAQGEYIYFLEDDDFLLPGFQNYVNKNINNSDLHLGLFNSNLEEIRVKNLQSFLDWRRGEYRTDHFQLSQMLFKKTELKWPKGNRISNDESLLKEVLKVHKPALTTEMFFFKRVHGKNMSNEYFEGFNDYDRIAV